MVHVSPSLYFSKNFMRYEGVSEGNANKKMNEDGMRLNWLACCVGIDIIFWHWFKFKTKIWRFLIFCVSPGVSNNQHVNLFYFCVYHNVK